MSPSQARPSPAIVPPPGPGGRGRRPPRGLQLPVLGALVPALAIVGGVAHRGDPAGPALALGQQGDPSGLLGLEDGAVTDGVTVFDEVPAVTNLDAAFLAALRRAASDTGDDGVQLDVNSGWRSRAYQEQLLREAISEYGSEDEAARWVSTPDTSFHVSGTRSTSGARARPPGCLPQGAGYGLCQIYDNEPWHFELRPDAVDDGCPDQYRPHPGPQDAAMRRSSHYSASVTVGWWTHATR